MENKYLKNSLLALVAIFIYFTFSSFELSIFELLGFDYETMPNNTKTTFLIIFSLIETLIMIGIFKDTLKKDIKDLKENHESYFKNYFKFWIYILIVMAVSNTLITMFTGSITSNNEAAVRDSLVKSPVYIYILSVIVAPIIEELIFRKSLRNIIPYDKLFIVVSGLVFGGLHVITSISSPLDLLYLIPYCTPGLIFAYIYTKTNNITISMAIHFIHNGVLTSMQILIFLFLT